MIWPSLYPVFVAALLMVLAFSLVWAVQRRTGNAGEVDAVWAWSLGGAAVVYAALGSGDAQARVLVAMLGGCWGLRLGLHLWRRNHGRPEDGRYARFRAEWGARADFNLFWFFQFQVVMALLLSAGFWVIAHNPRAPEGSQIALAVLIWTLSVAGEALADRQLERHRRQPENHGRVCRRGLWRYSRHPNYFFETTHWLAYVPLAIGAPWAWLVLLPPVVMAWLLLRMSGVPLTEAQAAASRPGYADYIATTSAFIPWPPRRQRPADPAAAPRHQPGDRYDEHD